MDTQTRIIQAALKLFAERGFYGASMDQIAREVGVTKQALIHHFGSKEKLYGAVLADISEQLLEVVSDQSLASAKVSEYAFADAVLRIWERCLSHPLDTQLLMRELLDNRKRAAQAGTWYLRPFLDSLAALLAQSNGWQGRPVAEIGAHVYQLLGAINYYAVSTLTLSSMYSEAEVKAIQAAYPEQLRRLAKTRP